FLKWILAIGIAIGVTDAFNYRVLKKLSQRSRPPHSQDFRHTLRLKNSPSDPSFPSNHAANMFASATVLAAAIPHLGWAAWLLAFLVAYSRPYVGVHFPLDVIFGALVGFCLARILTRQIFCRFSWWEFPPLKKEARHI